LGEETIRRCKKKDVKIQQSTGRLAVYTTIFLDIGEHLLHKLFRGIAEADLKAHGKFVLTSVNFAFFVKTYF
jgi:hypothetical protein